MQQAHRFLEAACCKGLILGAPAAAVGWLQPAQTTQCLQLAGSGCITGWTAKIWVL